MFPYKNFNVPGRLIKVYALHLHDVVTASSLATLAKNLDPREARLMRLRYGLKDGKTRSIRECAEAMGISRPRAQQLAMGCLKKLREADDAMSLQEYLLSIA